MPYLFKPFLTGASPIRRTRQFLEGGKLIMKEHVKVMELHYNMFYYRDLRPKYGDPHVGLRDFYFWDIPQIQFKNPELQVVRFIDRNPVPFIRCWLNDGRDVLFDCDSKDRTSILDQLTKILGKQRQRVELEAMLKKQGASGDNNADSPAFFGFNRDRFCLCEVPGQVPCPGTVPLPKAMTGKYIIQMKEQLEEWENNLDAPYPTDKELQASCAWYPTSAMPEPRITKLPGLEKMYMKKPKQRTINFKPAEKLVQDFKVQKKVDEYTLDKKIKYV